jgi:energy-coupling factor transporter ATP-binding protein EcfA2
VIAEVLVGARGLELEYMPGTPFATQALRGVDLDVHRGEILALIGATGSGKSSFLQAIAGLLELSRGTVTYPEGWDAERLYAHVGVAFQMPEDQLFERTVLEDVTFGPRQLGWDGARARGAAERALGLVGLDARAFAERAPSLLSGGEKRRVALAGILAMEPALLLLDEPTAGLDAPGQALLAKLVRDLKERGTTVVMVTHELELLVGLATRVAVFHRGVVAAVGAAESVLADVGALHAAGLKGPFVPELVAQLEPRGWPVRSGMVAVDAVVDALRTARAKGKR